MLAGYLVPIGEYLAQALQWTLGGLNVWMSINDLVVVGSGADRLTRQASVTLVLLL